MRIEKDVGLDQLDRMVNLAKDEQEIILPREFRGLRVGLLSRLVQALISAFKANSDLNLYFPHLRFSAESDSAEKVKEILNDPQVLPAILMSPEVLAWNHEPIKKLMQPYLVDRFERVVHTSGKTLQMLAVDHSIDRIAYPESFYDQDSYGTTYKVRSGEYYSQRIEEFLSGKVRQSSFSHEELAAFGDLVSELVENTDQHGRTDYISGCSDRSVRGVTIRSVTLNSDQAPSSVSREGERVFSYLKSIKANGNPLHFIELSVFDSGLGIAESYPSYDGSFDQESIIVLRSFKKGVTSKPNGAGYGRGLDLALRIINSRGGFISVRTGRLSLYRDFIDRPIQGDDPTLNNGFFLLDESEGENGFYERQKMAGVAYTVLVPAK